VRSRWLVIGGVVGAVLGAAVAYIGATRVFICRDTPTLEAVCAGGFPLLAVAWGAAIGLVVGLLVGLVVSSRHDSHRDTTEGSFAPPM
jgi:hypothetical protein